MGEFFHMGGYGAFVWPAYLLSAGVLAFMTATTLRAYNRHKRLLHHMEDGGPEN